MLPTTVFVLVIYLGCIAWTIFISFTSSKVLPNTKLVGLLQYRRLLGTERWAVSVENILIYGASYIVGCLVLGFLLAVFIDQRVRFENTLRTIYLFPYALSFIVTGAVWQWLFNPQLGIEQAVRDLGWDSFAFGMLARPELAIFALVIAAIWQGAGLVMVMLLAGLRSVDSEILKAARVDGVPIWRAYVSIVLPELKPMIVTSVVLLAIAVVKVYDLVVAMTQGGPGIATEMPAKFVMDHLFERGNIGLATAAATLMLLAVLVVLVPWLHVEYFRKNAGARG
ncbi:MAG: sugar ABC transporter permease [Kaistia sp. SCN 65-12]|nr:MAG: sugar ABC transporter permease [Kaistia sp. SCN 65-12]